MKWISLILLAAIPLVGQAQIITELDGDLHHGAPLTILGQAFGSKETPAPVVWDDMESGDFNPTWRSTGTLRIDDLSRSSVSQYCGTNNFQGSGGDGGAGYFTSTSSILGERWFVQYWFQLDPNFDWGTSTYGNGDENLANVKIFRMWNPGNIDENFVIAVHGFRDSAPYTTEYVTDPGGGYTLSNFTSEWTKGEWHCLQFEYQESSLDTQDGEFRIWFDGSLELEDTTIKTREDHSELKRPLIVGFYDSWNDDGQDRDDFYIDDVYVDNSWARVEIGNASEYSLCTHREIQHPTSWRQDRITVQVNMGSFSDPDGLYLFVVDADGNTSSGFPLDGEAIDFGPPSEPGQPERKPQV